MLVSGRRDHPSYGLSKNVIANDFDLFFEWSPYWLVLETHKPLRAADVISNFPRRRSNRATFNIIEFRQYGECIQGVANWNAGNDQQGKLSDLNSKGGVPEELGTLELFDSKSDLSGVVECGARVIPEEPKKAEAPNLAPDDYKGEKDINRNAPLETQTVKAGDTLEGIARKHLGKDASDAEVARHAEEIAKVNGIENPRMIHPGDKLQVPGHTTDGGFITRDEQGNTQTQYQDGRYQFESKDGKWGVVRQPDGKGGYYEEGWGKQSEENYRIQKTKDGEYLILDHQGGTHYPHFPEEEARVKMSENETTNPVATRKASRIRPSR